ncbi:MAG: hypothetical protein CBC42_01655 [Betaproteobacteria bacterium TMED82]|nr:MAG: hypothetical protein CBC42_01655 [Betaproteobacteria bacterium TMED82]
MIFTLLIKFTKIVTLFLLAGCSFNQQVPAPVGDIQEERKIKSSEIPKSKRSSEELKSFSTPPQPANAWSKKGTLNKISYKKLVGWQHQDFPGAWVAWTRNCSAKKLSSELRELCSLSKKSTLSEKSIKKFFEDNFTPHYLKSSPGLITGYYEPVLKGSREKNSVYKFPIYKVPLDLISTEIIIDGIPSGKTLIGKAVETSKGRFIVPYPDRAAIKKKGLLNGKELVYLADPIDAFFLQIQGSGTIILKNNEVIRVGFAASNGRRYKSIGSWLIKEKELSVEQASKNGIKKWIEKNPTKQDKLLNINPRMIFFRELPASPDPSEGPVGSLGVPLTANFSLAVDQDFVKLGLPLFLTHQNFSETTNDKNLSFFEPKLMFAQDTGNAIKGPNRGDFFFGSGLSAGNIAGRTKFKASIVILLPNKF